MAMQGTLDFCFVRLLRVVLACSAVRARLPGTGVWLCVLECGLMVGLYVPGWQLWLRPPLLH